jgi:CO dehydrogenase maturation factor
MKIAISGKGGVGKTLLASLLSRLFAEAGYAVIAIDADPNSNLAITLGFPHPEKITPISEMRDLIEERTGTPPGKSGGFFTLNPRVDDLPDKYFQKHDGIKLMVMGRIKKGGTGCYCSENALLQALTTHLLLERNDIVIMDMEAGVEHLGRATAKAVDKLIIVVEPSRTSLETARRIDKLAREIGLKNIAVVGNKIRSQQDKDFLTANLSGFQFLGFIPYDQAVVEADVNNRPVTDASPKVVEEVKKIYSALLPTAVSKNT